MRDLEQLFRDSARLLDQVILFLLAVLIGIPAILIGLILLLSGPAWFKWLVGIAAFGIWVAYSLRHPTDRPPPSSRDQA